MIARCISCGKPSEGEVHCRECYLLTPEQRMVRTLVHGMSTADLKAEWERHGRGEEMSDGRESMVEEELDQRGEIPTEPVA